MSDMTMNHGMAGAPSSRPHMDARPHVAGAVAFILVLVAGLGYAAFSIATDIDKVGEHNLAVGALALLGLALLIALGFEFVNGFHDTANAVATVIYTHSLPPLVAVVWSGTFNFLGRADVQRCRRPHDREPAFGGADPAGRQRRGLRHDLRLHRSHHMNLGTWVLGLPNSSSHALIGIGHGSGLGQTAHSHLRRGHLRRQLGASGGRTVIEP